MDNKKAIELLGLYNKGAKAIIAYFQQYGSLVLNLDASRSELQNMIVQIALNILQQPDKPDCQPAEREAWAELKDHRAIVHLIAARYNKDENEIVDWLFDYQPLCDRCGDTKEVYDTQEFGGRDVGDLVPCPDCPPAKPEPKELLIRAKRFLKAVRISYEEDIYEPDAYGYLNAILKIASQQAEELKRAKEVCRAIKIRIHFIGLPNEPRNAEGVDWSKEICLLEQVLPEGEQND